MNDRASENGNDTKNALTLAATIEEEKRENNSWWMLAPGTSLNPFISLLLTWPWSHIWGGRWGRCGGKDDGGGGSAVGT